MIVKEMKRMALCLFLLLFAGSVWSAAKEDRTEQRVDSVLRLMTLSEKIGQMNQVSSKEDPTGQLTECSNEEELIRSGQVGSMLNVVGVERTRHLQEIAVNDTRLHIPLIFALDVVHGYKTISPVPLAESCSWDMDLIEKSARVAAEEATASGIQWTFAPMVDIARDPRWGRVMEGSGEDPYLGSAIAKARVRGFQGTDLSAYNTMAACAKHFVGYGAAEGGRDYNTVDISKQRLRELYLPPFSAAADAGVATFMNSFNEVMGVPATGSTYLVRDILKGEWNFPGVVVSDWGSVAELIPHGVAEDKCDAAQLAVTAGCDMDMEGYCYVSSLEKLVLEGVVSESLIDDAVRRILRLKFDLGLFDDPYRYCDAEREKAEILSAEHRKVVREMACKSIVLLENREGILPLDNRCKNIGIVGPLADNPDDMLGSWCARGDGKDAIGILQGIKQAVGKGVRIRYAKGCEIEGDDRSGFSEAVQVAENSDVVIVCVGENRFMSGEAASRTRLTLPGVQRELLKAIKETGKPIVLLLSNGRPLVLDWEKENIGTIVECWQLGSEAGNAIADVLFGKYNPSGKLTMSFPYNEGQIPVYYNAKSTGRPYVPNVRYVTRYLDCPNVSLYSFGYGLSYTRFEYGELKLDKDTMFPGEKLRIDVSVANVGNYDGEETVQLYIRDVCSKITRPEKELKGFKKVFLKKGERTDISFELSLADLEYVLADGSRESDPGLFEVFVGGNPDDVKKAEFILVQGDK
ncbi:glycoside hydrolase family 3 N-terminal domain-containing protein [Barnesiella intestinihominis]|uniref:glycoside hydrolase family 3 N-terminal domain-containing protein n=1 Tax=Barnesiella intestinihominis TaxID=487174 RepID=UPI0020792C19|nr:glycoside hydrolase family 3 N-terminal domain-containing protein [Barnesiella intestinihominis]